MNLSTPQLPPKTKKPSRMEKFFISYVIVFLFFRITRYNFNNHANIKATATR